MKTVAALMALSFMLLGFNTAFGKILPDNDLHLEDNLFSEDANMTQDDFNRITDEVTSVYEDIIAAHGGTLSVNKRWTDGTVNASAQQIGTSWIINMYGGLARRPEVTEDGYALVVCHELGHHLAGFPFYDSGWAASEGQSDYFATQACARLVWGEQHEKNAASAATVNEVAKLRCDRAWTEPNDRNLCYRTAMGGESLAKLLAALGGTQADFDTPDESEVSRTQTSHPQGQCRLDTYFYGALCGEAFEDNVIPGRHHADGQQSLGAEMEAAKRSCTRAAFHPDGLRPRCWYAPKLKSLLSVESIELTELVGNGNGTLEPNESASIVVRLQNLANQAYNQVTANIASIGDKFEVLRGVANYDSIAAKTSKAGDAPFEIRVGDLTCGELFDIDLQVNLGELGEGRGVKFKHTAQVGRMVSTDPLAIEANLPIPDNSDAGVESVINVNEAGAFPKVDVTIDITHTYRGDISLTLKSPSGESFEVRPRGGGSTDDIKGTFEVALPAGLEVAGNWTLHVRDHANRDTGTLNNWALTFTKAVCD